MKKPNLIYIFADQWRRHALGFMNEDPVLTPRMDAFASESLVFDQALSACPLCSPHRASMMTGKYPFSTGVWTNCKTGLPSPVYLKPDDDSFGNSLKREGYSTAYLGKWHLDNPELNNSDHPLSGASGWDAYTPPGEKRQGFDFWHSYGAMDNHADPHYWEDSHRKIRPGKWSVEHETDTALRFLEEQNQAWNPFALFISYNPPHTPFDQVPSCYRDLYRNTSFKPRDNVRTGRVKDHTGPWENLSDAEHREDCLNYFAAVSGIDHNVGRLLDYLEEAGLKDNTIVVLSADHGEMLGSHSLLHKHVWFEESVGIPFIIRWPGKIQPDRTGALLNSPDHLPSILALMGIRPGDSVQGFDYSDHMLGRECGALPEQAFLAAYPGRADAVRAFEQKGLNNLSYGWRALRTHSHCYVVHRGYAPGEKTVRYLYNLMEDPLQTAPLMPESPGDSSVAAALEARLKDWLDSINDPFGDEL